MNPDAVDSIINVQFANGRALIDYLTENKQLDLLSDAENNFRKVLLLSVASFFEKEVLELVLGCAETHAHGNELITSLIKNKAVDRQYFTYFDWSANNANNFFSLFGTTFKKRIEKRIKDNDELGEAVRAFLQLGRDRNNLVHRNFAEYNIEANADDIKASFDKATRFIEVLREELNSNEDADEPLPATI